MTIRLAALQACLIVTGVACHNNPTPRATPWAPTDLRVELLRGANVAIDTATPRFGWALPNSDIARQTAYRISVASTPTALAQSPDVWDSGVIPSSASQGVAYGGAPLNPMSQYFWRVQVWGGDADSSPYSATQSFVVGDFSSTTPPRLPLVTEVVAATSILETAPGRLFVTFPAAAYGTVILDFPRQGASASLDLILGEHRVGNAVWRSADDAFTPEISIVVHEAPITWNGAPGQLRLDLPVVPAAGAAELPDGVTGILPFRYVEVIGDPALLREITVLQLVVTYPFDTNAGTFASSDSVLNDVWALSKYTMKATSAFGIYVDGNRERRPYEADAYINQLGHYGVDADYSLARFTIDHLMKNPTWPTEWILHDVLLAWADYIYTGDDTFLQTHYEQLSDYTLIRLARNDGLISTTAGLMTPELLAELGLPQPLRDIVDWPVEETDGYDFTVDYNTVVNLVHYRSLVLMASIAEVVGRPADVEMFHDRSERVRNAILAKLLDRQRGLFIDGEGSTHASLHANMFALAFGVIPDEFRSNVIAFVESKGLGASVYGAQYLLEGLYREGRGDHALSLLTSRDLRSWAHMIYDLGATIAHEAWDPSLKPNEDWNHAWGAAPANIIPRWLMGIQPLSPGFETFLVAPQIGTLEWAEIRHPTVRGPIVVRAERGGGTATITIDVPANSEALVKPLCRGGDQTRVWVDTAPHGPSAREQPGLVGPLPSGRHTIACVGP